MGTCRALQSLLNTSPASSPRRAKPERLQSPLQVRPPLITRPQKVVKPAPKPPRGVNKRRRDCYENDAEGEGILVDEFSTPKRRRRAPPELPPGLAQSDFRSPEGSCGLQKTSPSTRSHANADCEKGESVLMPTLPKSDAKTTSSTPGTEWTSDDDRRLVELVLEKLKLSKRDWNECARKMGKDNDSVGRRWKALVGEGNVGLRRGRRMVRGRIDESWR